MGSHAVCPKCNSALPPGALEGLCPQCLIKAVLEGDSDVVSPSPVDPTRFVDRKELPDSIPPHSPLADSIPGYEILREVHRGGQGVVYQALQKGTRRRVAIKVMREGPFSGEHERSRFEREVRILAALRHPHIVSIHDSGSAAGCFYFTMDYIPGDSLDHYVEQHALLLNDALRLFAKVCDAVNAAHLRGIIHRDLKPANIRVDTQGEPHILDFGLARVALGGMTDESCPQMMTMTGEFIGSPPWASPEQAEGLHDLIDVRTDVYALGVILFQVLTRKFPYDVTGHVMDVLERVRSAEPIRPVALRKDIGDEVETIILKCLAKDRERRYQSAGELARDINHYLSGEPIEAKRDSTLYVLKKALRRYRLPVAIAAAFVALITVSLVVSVSLWFRARQNFREAEQGRKAAVEARELADAKTREAEANAREVTRQLYGRQLMLAQQALETNSSTLQSLLDQCPADLRGWEWYRLKKLADQSRMTIAAYDTDALAVAFSPDGRLLASTGTDLRLRDAQTGELLHERKKLIEYKASMVAFSPSGDRLVFCGCGTGGPLEVWDPINWQCVWALDLKDQPCCARFSPDGSCIAVGAWSGDVSVRNPLNGDEIQTLKGHQERITSVAYSADGHWLASASFDGTVRIWDAATGYALHVLKNDKSRAFDVAFSPAGGTPYVASANDDKTVRLWDAATGKELHALHGHTSAAISVAFSPDGSHLCSGGRDATLRLWDVATGGELAALRGHTKSVMSVAFSPDGKTLASASRDKTIRFWDSQPVGPERLIPIPGGPAREIAFSATGEHLLARRPDGILAWDSASGQLLPEQTYQGLPQDYTPDHKRKLMLDMIDKPSICDAMTGDILVRIQETGRKIATIRLSPDGTRVAASTVEGFYDIWDAGSGTLLQSVKAHDGLSSLDYSPDGTKIATCGWDGTARLWDEASGQELVPVMRIPHWVTDVAFSHDGRRIVTVASDVRIWDAETGYCLATYAEVTNHGYPSVAFSPDGRSIAALCSVNGHPPELIKIWDAATPGELTARTSSTDTDPRQTN